MIICQVRGCHWECTSSDQYFRHVVRMHDSRDGYKCFRQCGRLFTSIKSLKKHVLSCKENNTAELPKEDLKHPEHAVKHEEKNISENLKNFSLPCQHIENENQVQVRNIDQYDANDSSLKMTLKWLSEDGLSRKIAFDINKDVKLNVIEPLHTLINDLQSSGAMSLECKRSIDSLLANFNCTSEHKFIQHLKTRDLYENPSFFTIHEELQECSEDQLHQQVDIAILLIIDKVSSPYIVVNSRYIKNIGQFVLPS